MSYRFTLAAVAVVFALTGCAKKATVDQPDFTSGVTLVTVTHVPTKTDDGTQVYVTVDGSDAGVLPSGESIDVHLPAGKHKVGGYARSLIGKVTIPAIDVTTSREDVNHVTYSITKLKPAFTLGKKTPVPKPATQVVPETPSLAEPTQTIPATPEIQVAPAAAQQTQQTETPATTTTQSATTTAQPAATTTPSATTTAQPATTTVPVTVQQSQVDTQSSTPQAVIITNLTETPQA